MPPCIRITLLACIVIAPAWGASLQQTSAAVPGMAARLDDTDLAVAGEAAGALAGMGADAFPAIRELLASGSAQQRWGATVALYRSDADPAPFLPELTRHEGVWILNPGSPTERRRAPHRSLMTLNLDGGELRPRLIALV